MLLNQWKLQKKFNNISPKEYIYVTHNIYKKIYLCNHMYIFITLINILTNTTIKVNVMIGRIIKLKNKFSIIFKEKYNKFIININIKSPNLIYDYSSAL